MNTWVMSAWVRMWWMAALLTALSAASPASRAATATLGTLQLPNFDAIADKAVKTVDISLNTTLLGLAAGFMDSSKPEDADVKELISSLKGIYVRSYTFDEDFVYPAADVDALRKQLSDPSWQRLVAVHDSPRHSNVDIYICIDRGHANGLAIIASQPREFTIVNIVGAVDLKKLHQLQGKFGIPQMPLPSQ
jgi:Domain of unknown function (DUF4252)